MKHQIIFFAWAVCTLTACNGNTKAGVDSTATAATDSLNFNAGFKIACQILYICYWHF